MPRVAASSSSARPSIGKTRRPTKRPKARKTREFDVETLVDLRVVEGEEEYLVKWVGFDSNCNTWATMDNLGDFGEEVDRLKDKLRHTVKVVIELRTEGNTRLYVVKLAGQSESEPRETREARGSKWMRENAPLMLIDFYERGFSDAIVRGIPKCNQIESIPSPVTADHLPSISPTDDVVTTLPSSGNNVQLVHPIDRVLRLPSPTPPIAAEVSDELAVEQILNRKIKEGVMCYEIKWKGYSHAANTWEPLRHFENSCRGLVAEYNKTVRDAMVKVVGARLVDGTNFWYDIRIGANGDTFSHSSDFLRFQYPTALMEYVEGCLDGEEGVRVEYDYSGGKPMLQRGTSAPL